MEVFQLILLGFLVVCAISVSLSKNLLNSILIYMSLQPCGVGDLDSSGISGSGDYRGRSRSRYYECTLFCHAEENSRDDEGRSRRGGAVG